MALEKILQSSGVQMMLRNLLAAAAPDLAAQVEDVANVINAFKQQLDRIETNQQRIMLRLGINYIPQQEVIDHANNGRAAERAAEPERPRSEA